MSDDAKREIMRLEFKRLFESHGGAAFPLDAEVEFKSGPTEHFISFGMSLRDYLAAQILQALIAKQPLWDTETGKVPPEGIDTWRRHTCESAYSYADAMLKARGR